MKINFPKTLDLNNLPKVQGRGLTTAGIIVLQLLFLTFVPAVEIFFSDEPGLFTGFTLFFLLYGAIKIGRKGTLFSAVVWLPITLSGTLLFTLATVGGNGIAPIKIGTALITSLARLAPYLVIVTIIGWVIYYLREVKVGPPANPS